MKTYVKEGLPGAEAEVSPLEEAMQRGVAASEAGDKATAHAIFREVTSSYPDALEGWVWLGWTSPDPDESESAFRRAHLLDPSNEEANLGLRWAASRRAPVQTSPDVTDALANAEMPAPTSPSTGPVAMGDEAHSDEEVEWNLEEMMHRGITAAQAGDKLTAYSTFQMIVARQPALPEVWVWLGGTSPTLDAAQMAFNQALELDPHNEEAQLGIRWVAARRRATLMGNTTGNLRI